MVMNRANYHPVLGRLADFWGSLLLGVNHRRFYSDYGIAGLAQIDGRTLQIIAVYALNPGHGDFHRFMIACKEYFETIYVMEIWNKWLPGVLTRYGFSHFDVEGSFCMKWSKPNETTNAKSGRGRARHQRATRR